MRFFPLFFIFLLSGCNPNQENLHGYVEGEYIYVAPTTSEVLKDLFVHRGDSIKEGDMLFALEDTQLKAYIEISKAQIIKMEAKLEDDKKEYERLKRLNNSGNVSHSEFDKIDSQYQESIAELEIAKQQLLSSERQLEASAPKANSDAFVEETFFLPGEFITSGKPVVSLLPYRNIKIRFFIPQSQLSQIQIGKAISISWDGAPKPIIAKVTYISSQAEYTPPVIYSTESRKKLVFMIEAKPDNFEPTLHPGLPVDVDLRGRNE